MLTAIGGPIREGVDPSNMESIRIESKNNSPCEINLFRRGYKAGDFITPEDKLGMALTNGATNRSNSWRRFPRDSPLQPFVLRDPVHFHCRLQSFFIYTLHQSSVAVARDCSSSLHLIRDE